jgi:hypothetical protein
MIDLTQQYIVLRTFIDSRGNVYHAKPTPYLGYELQRVPEAIINNPQLVVPFNQTNIQISVEPTNVTHISPIDPNQERKIEKQNINVEVVAAPEVSVTPEVSVSPEVVPTVELTVESKSVEGKKK